MNEMHEYMESTHRFENLEESLEKKEEGLELASWGATVGEGVP